MKTWYNAPEWLHLVAAYTVTKESNTEVRIAAVDATAYFSDDRRILVMPDELPGYVTSATFDDPDTIVTVELDGAEVVPANTDDIYSYILDEAGREAFATAIDILFVQTFL
jgi:hypothetical protein